MIAKEVAMAVLTFCYLQQKITSRKLIQLNIWKSLYKLPDLCLSDLGFREKTLLQLNDTTKDSSEEKKDRLNLSWQTTIHK